MRSVILGEIADFVSGVGFPKDRQGITEGDLPFAKVSDISAAKAAGNITISQANNYISHDVARSLRAKPFPSGSIVFAKIGEAIRLNNRAITQRPMAFDNNVMGIVPNIEAVNVRYLYYYLDTRDFYQIANSTAVPSIRKTDIAQLEIPLPPIEEQKRIAAILDQADSLRRLRQRAIDRLNTLGQGIFHEMFGDPVTNTKRWRTSALQYSAECINDCPHSTPSWSVDGYVCLRTSNILKGEWSWFDTRYVPEMVYHERSSRGYLQEGDIVLSREGTVGIAAIVPSNARWCMGQRLVQVRPAADQLSSEYLLNVLLSLLDPARIGKVMVGSTSRHLNVKELRTLRIPIPPKDLQDSFSERIGQIRMKQHKNHRASVSSARLFSSLQARAFRGEL